jgi:GR25 family glycosyltransferase involved in LPS biosynthesis
MVGGPTELREHRSMPNIAKYVINLDDRKDRRAEMELQLSQIGWQAQFSGSQRPTSAAGFPSAGVRGCYESHLSALKRGKLCDSPILLMEDDLNFVPNFSELWEQAITELDQVDWSILYPAHYLAIRSEGLALLDPSVEIMCAHFMMFHPKVVGTIIEELEAMLKRPAGHPIGGPMHVDGAYLTIRKRHSEIKTFTFSPSLGYQRPSKSDIAPLRFYDRIPALQPAARLYRRLKNSIVL